MTVKLRDRITAQALELGSVIGTMTPRLAEAVGHKNDSPQLAARWRFAGYGTDKVASWQEFEGIPSSGRIPERYGAVALMSIDKERMDDWCEKLNGDQAVLYALGTAVMAGTVKGRPEFLGEDPDDSARYAVGMRVGKGVLRTAFGVRASRGFVVDITEGTEKGPVMPLSEWPRSVPII